MATPPVQTDRLLQLITPLGQDVLIPIALNGSEGLSELFAFTVEMTSTNAGITADQLLGKSATLKIRRPDADPRIINGIIASFAAADQTVDGLRRYHMVLRPKLWLLTRTADCRIFQNQTVPQIADTLLSEAGVTDTKKQGLNGSHPSRDYCVQYRETDFDFLVRLWAEEGIYYYFQHSDGQHTLVLSDSTAGYCECIDKSVQHAPPSASDTIAVQTWRVADHFSSGKVTLRDYNFEQPTTDLSATTATVLSNSAFKQWELFDYPGDYTQKGDGTTLSRTRMEEVEARYAITEGEATYRGFMPGAKITMAKHEVAVEQGQSYVLAWVHHEAEDRTHLGRQAETPRYRNTFTALPAATPFRPPPVTRRPLISGPQTATVVGPSGEEIYCDKYGRIRVQFPWDRLGKNDENSSCWIRVGQWIAGATWGSQFVPRVGMEVIVVFLEGDPDRPLVVGTVYNGQNMPPYVLPDNKTQSGIKTRSSSQGSASTFNELRFEDKKGSELVYMHAQKDFTREVVNDDTLTVQHDQTLTIKNDRTETVQEGNEKVTVSKGNRSLTVSAGNDTTEVTSGNYTVKLGSGNALHQCEAGSITLEAAQSITLKVGENTIVVNQTGITLTAIQITLKADAKIQANGAMVNVDGSGMVQVTGGLVTIN
ncbi:Actin cross-linking toxin VgrG1 [Methylobacterium crusticola]|uniref:Actin cross-linking toxin VgrG1 n=1 Tax=Methylobacterium crusticola TaxID=1697972 RepID=A0ABQ4R0V3_9HYPH|nr:type VI secretion system tip protein VgrG [Methylobacterium crusticola]GJD50494.1 Actin cross-linking toxin VgrG1 [Methylobacterium crusticola]